MPVIHATVLSLLTGCFIVAHGHVHADPGSTTSRYISTRNSDWFESTGCYISREGQSGAVILAFGKPVIVEAGGPTGADKYGTYGLGSFEEPISPGLPLEFIPIARIKENVEAFAKGYHRSDCLGTQDISMRIIVGTSNNLGETGENSALLNASGTAIDTARAAEHGRQWRIMTNELQATMVSQGFAPVVGIAAGIDAEQGWATPEITHAWVDGYQPYATQEFYNFGDASGCWPGAEPFYTGTPAEPFPTDWHCDVATDGAKAVQLFGPTIVWPHADVRYISHTLFLAHAFPEIYRVRAAPGYLSSNAWQWQKVSLFGPSQAGQSRIFFAGALTERGACEDRQEDFGCVPLNTNPPIVPCPGPECGQLSGWANLYYALANDSRTENSPTWASDIRWDGTFESRNGATEKIWGGSAVPMLSFSSVFPPIVTAIFDWDETAQAYRFWFRGFPDSSQTLTAGIQTGTPYIFQAGGSSEIRVPSDWTFVLPQPWQVSVSTAIGATNVVWSGTDVPSPSAMASYFPGHVTAVFDWSDEAQSFKFWFRGFPDNFQTLSEIRRGESYYLQANAQGSFWLW